MIRRFHQFEISQWELNKIPFFFFLIKYHYLILMELVRPLSYGILLLNL